MYPDMTVVIKKLSRYLEKKMSASGPAVSEEFAALGRQVKQVLYGLMENKQWQEAYGVVNQLAALLPEDLEVLKLKQEILRQS
jgi:regulator of sirC expression with transglutaminase-like and TPR domain